VLAKYKHIVIQNPTGPPDASELAVIERELGVALPPSFVDFLRVANGGSPEYSINVPPGPDGEELMFCDLFVAGKDRDGEYGAGTLLGEIREHRNLYNIPVEVLPFARDGGDNVVFLDLTVQGGGRVVAFVHGLPAWTGGHEDDRLVEVAPGFDEYISNLHLPEDIVNEAVELIEQALKDNDPVRLGANRELLDLAVPDWREKYPHLT